MRDGFLGLRHDAVVRAHDEHDNVRDFRAARSHARERLVAGRIDEDDAPVAHVYFVRADVLRDSPGFARGDFGFADRVEQAGLAVVHVAHDGHDGSAWQQISRALFLDLLFLNDLLFERDYLHDAVESLGEVCCGRNVERLVDAGENAAVEQCLQQVLRANIELFSEIADGDAFRDGDCTRFALNRSDGLGRGGATPARACARAHRMQPALAFGVSLFDHRTSARRGRFARVERLTWLGLGHAARGAGPLAPNGALSRPTTAAGALRES